MKTYRSYSSEGTKKLAESFARKILKRGPRRRNAIVLALSGELGSGKTTFVQGFLRGLGVRRGGASPTFILMRRHGLHRGKFKNIYHVDAYRIKKPDEFLSLDPKETLADQRNIVLIEWAENIKKILPKSAIWLCFSHTNKENARKILFR